MRINHRIKPGSPSGLSAILYFAAAVLTTLASCGSSDGGSDLTYVAIGASDATGIGAAEPTQGYVYLIEDGLEQDGRNVDLVNLGIPGAKVQQMKDLETPVAKEKKPDIVTIFAGGNDIVDGTSAAGFEEDLASIMDSLTENRPPLMFIATLPDLTQLPRFRENPSESITSDRVTAFNDAIRRQAQRHGATVVDLYAQGVSDVLVSDDGFHPSTEGHRQIADLFLASIRPQLPPAE